MIVLDSCLVQKRWAWGMPNLERLRRNRYMGIYEGYDNTELIRVNFISDDTIAADMNKRCKQANTPLVASPCLMGGYRYPILEDIADGRVFQILKTPIPGKDAKKFSEIKAVVKAPETLYSYVDQGRVTIVQVEGHNRHERPLSSYGWNVVAGPKTFKRLKQLDRAFRLADSPERELRVIIVDDDSYSNEDLTGFDPSLVERLLDGAFVISRELFEGTLANVRFPVYGAEQFHENPHLAVDYFRSQEYLRQAQYFHAFNARITGPMHFIGLHAGEDERIRNQPVALKGEAFICVADTLEKMHADIICTRSAFKFEVASSDKTYVLLEPQKAKRSGANSDLQTVSNLPAMYSYKQVKESAEDYLASAFHRLCNDEILDSWFDMGNPLFNLSDRLFDQQDLITLTKWNARAWKMSGRKFTESPWLFRQMASAFAKSLSSSDPRRLRFPIPCAVRAQVISQSFASMAGCDMDVIQGTIRWSNDLEALIVNDLDWIEMYESHGGMDLDDFFIGYYRTIGNWRKIVVTRSPNDWGEYSIFDYVADDWFPVWERSDGTCISFPEVSAKEELWPKRLSEAVREGLVQYQGLPSEKEPANETSPQYGVSEVLRLMKNNVVSGNCVGANVNARTLHALTLKKHRPVQLASMEACIDAGVQGGSLVDTTAVQDEAKQIVKEIVDSGLPIDEYMWVNRFARHHRYPFPKTRLTKKSRVHRIHHMRLNMASEFMAMVKDYTQKHLVSNIDPVIHKLGKKHYRRAVQVLLESRRAVVFSQSYGNAQVMINDWDDIHAPIIGTLKALPTDIDRHDFIMALYSACFKVPTRTSDQISDQLVMNPHVFPYLLDAMRFYGLAAYIDLDEYGRIHQRFEKSWLLHCESCSNEKETDNPCVLQSYHTHNKICSICRSSD